MIFSYNILRLAILSVVLHRRLRFGPSPSSLRQLPRLFRTRTLRQPSRMASAYRLRGTALQFLFLHIQSTLRTVIQELLSAGVIVRHSGIVNAFRLFLVSKQEGSARPILDLSPWTHYYSTPPMRLFSAAEVIHAIPRGAYLIKLDLLHGFFQLSLHSDYCKFYGICYRGQCYAWTRLPMGHPLAPAHMQTLAVAVARYLHARHD
jgi:hypothetical protein